MASPETYDMVTSNPTEYATALRGYPQNQFTIGQRVRPASKGLATDPGYEGNYRTGDPGVVEQLSASGYRVGVRFADGGFCIYTALEVAADTRSG